MQVPSFLYGRFRDVKATCQRKITQIKRGAHWDELADDLIDTADVPGLLILDGPSPLLGNGEHFHFFAPAHALSNAIPLRLPESTFFTLFEPMIASRWGFLTMLGQWAQRFLLRPGHQQRFLHALVNWWDELVAEGPRYSNGGGQGDTLWNLFTNIQFCLAREGLPQELLSQPVPPGGIGDLVNQTTCKAPIQSLRRS